MQKFHAVLSKLRRRNTASTPKAVIVDQLNEPRPLPMGMAEFNEWASRIIGGALLPKDPAADQKVFEEGQTFALANMLLHLGPTESHKPDAFFIHSLRKFAVNQVADAVRVELRDKAKARLAEQEAAAKEASALKQEETKLIETLS